MKHSKRRVSKIVDELINYLFSIGATNINVNILDEENQYKIKFKSNFDASYHNKIEKLIKCLNYDKQEEMEEYYWELAGETDSKTELILVGMMTDEFDFTIHEDNFELTIYRYKERP